MDTKAIIQIVGLIAGIILPLWNIPLIIKIYKRKSSKDISIWWVCGVWACLLLMLPSGLVSTDIVWKTFNAVNFVLFSSVLVFVIMYRK